MRKHLATRFLAALTALLSLAAAAAGEQVLEGPHGLEFVRIPAGEFTMGARDTEAVLREMHLPDARWVADETPAHPVTLTRPFYMGRTEVTQEQWLEVMGTRPGPAANWERSEWRVLPVVGVSWEDAQEFIRRLNAEGPAVYRLPTEAEWEYVARAGAEGLRPFTRGALRVKAWYLDNSRNEPQAVASLGENPLGVCDMLGNAWEWTQDWYYAHAYDADGRTDPTGPPEGLKKVLRGGSFHCPPELVRPGYREAAAPDSRDDIVGFRVVREL